MPVNRWKLQYTHFIGNMLSPADYRELVEEAHKDAVKFKEENRVRASPPGPSVTR